MEQCENEADAFRMATAPLAATITVKPTVTLTNALPFNVTMSVFEVPLDCPGLSKLLKFWSMSLVLRVKPSVKLSTNLDPTLDMP